MKNSDKPAHPLPDSRHYTNPEHGRGLTKRELFAMAAMQGMLTNQNFDGKYFEEVARDAVACADGLLKQLETKIGN